MDISLQYKPARLDKSTWNILAHDIAIALTWFIIEAIVMQMEARFVCVRIIVIHASIVFWHENGAIMPYRCTMFFHQANPEVIPVNRRGKCTHQIYEVSIGTS